MTEKQLVAQWRKTRSPEIADALDAFAGEPFTGAVAARETRWLAAASKGDVAAFVATPWPARWQHARPRVEAVKKIVDPRVGMMLARAIETIPWTARGALSVYRAIGARLVAIADPRTVPLVEAGIAGAAKHYDAERCEALVREIAEDLAAAVKAKYKGDGKKLARAKPAARDVGALLAAIHADPDDTAARLVYADALIEQGDLQGELISLQCSGGSSARIKQLIARNFDRWLGPLTGIVKRDGVVFERGFLAEVDTKLRSRTALVPVTGDPRWATVRKLVLDKSWAVGSDQFVPFLAHPVMAALRSVEGVSPEQLLELARERPLPWTEVAFMQAVDDPAGIDRALPGIEWLGCWSLREAKKLLDRAFFHRLVGLRSRGEPLELMRYIAKRKPAKLRELVVYDGSAEWTYTFSRERAGGAWSLVATRRKRDVDPYWFEELFELIEALPDLAAVTVAVPRDAHAMVAAWARKHGRAIAVR